MAEAIKMDYLQAMYELNSMSADTDRPGLQTTASFITADPRYLQKLEEWFEAEGTPENQRTSIRQTAQAAHDAAVGATGGQAPGNGDIGQTVEGFYESIVDPVPVKPETYTVAEGDSLSKIVRDKYGLTDPQQVQAKALELASANSIDNPDLIMVGQKLDLPGIGPSPYAIPNFQTADGATGATVNEPVANTTSSGFGIGDVAMGIAGAVLPGFSGIAIASSAAKIYDTLTTATATPVVSESALNTAWALKGTHVPEYLRAPEPVAAAPAVDTTKPGWSIMAQP